MKSLSDNCQCFCCVWRHKGVERLSCEWLTDFIHVRVLCKCVIFCWYRENDLVKCSCRYPLAFCSFQIFPEFIIKYRPLKVLFCFTNLCIEADDLSVILFVFVVNGRYFIGQLSFVISCRFVCRINVVHTADAPHTRRSSCFRWGVLVVRKKRHTHTHTHTHTHIYTHTHTHTHTHTYIQDAYKLSGDFAKPYFHKYWTEIHDVTTIWKSNHFQRHYKNCESASTPQSGTSHKTCLRGFGGNGSIAWTSAVSHLGRTSNAFKVTMKLQTFLFQMAVTSCISVQYL